MAALLTFNSKYVREQRYGDKTWEKSAGRGWRAPVGANKQKASCLHHLALPLPTLPPSVFQTWAQVTEMEH